MRRLALLILLVLPAPAWAQPDYEGLNRALSEAVVVPAYQRLAGTAARLEADIGAFCEQPTPEGYEKSLAAFHAMMDAWQRAQPIAFGPVTWEGRAARIEFWPDKNGVGARQLRKALAAMDPELAAPGGLEGKSVALQSLSALERILFTRGERLAAGGGSDEDRYACALAVAIARYQAALAAGLVDDWTGPDGYLAAVLGAVGGNANYATADEASRDFLKSLVGAIDAAIQLKIERPLGASPDKARPRRAESWRSGRSLDNIVANLETAQALYIAPGGFGDLMTAVGSGPLDLGLRKAFEDALALAHSVGMPLREAVKDPEGRAHLDALLEKLRSLRLLISGSVASDLGLTIGFNAMDGD